MQGSALDPVFKAQWGASQARSAAEHGACTAAHTTAKTKAAGSSHTFLAYIAEVAPQMGGVVYLASQSTLAPLQRVHVQAKTLFRAQRNMKSAAVTSGGTSVVLSFMFKQKDAKAMQAHRSSAGLQATPTINCCCAGMPLLQAPAAAKFSLKAYRYSLCLARNAASLCKYRVELYICSLLPCGSGLACYTDSLAQLATQQHCCEWFSFGSL